MTTCTGFIEPLNLECIMLNMFAGTAEIFTFFALIFVAGLAARFRMTNGVAMVMFALFGIIFSTYIGGIYLIIMLLAGIITFYGMARIMK